MKIVKDLENAFVIESLVSFGDSFKMSYRSYSLKHECGGFLTTLTVKGDIECANIFCCMHLHELKHAESLTGMKITSKKCDNKVSEKHTYNKVKKMLN